MTRLSHTVARGAAWTYGTSALVLLAQIAYTATTSRLIDPAGFGAYATAQALTSFVGYFTLSSLGSAVTRAPVLTSVHRWTALGLASLGGLVGAIGLWLLAPAWASLWSSPSSVPVVRALVLTTVVSPVGAVCVGLIRRGMRLRVAALVETFGALGGMVGGLVLVSQWHDAQALALGLGMGAVATGGLAWTMGLGLGRISFSRAAARSLLSFSTQVSGQNFIYNGVNTAPTLWVSRVAGASALGQFSRGSLIVGLPLTQLAGGCSKSLYPAYAQLQGDAKRMRDAVTDALVTVSGISTVLFAGLAGCSPVLVPLLLGPRWGTAQALVPAFCVSAAINIVFVILANAFEAKAMLSAAWRVQLVLLAALALVLTLTSVTGSPLWLLAGSLGVAYAGAHVVQLMLASRAGLVDARRVATAYAVHAMAASLLGGTTWLVAAATAGDGVLMAMCATAGTALTLCALLWWVRGSIPAYRAVRSRGLFPRLVRAEALAEVGGRD